MSNDVFNVNDLANVFTRLNMLIIGKKSHIKKYKKIRKLHGEVLDSMESYFFENRDTFRKYSNSLSGMVARETKVYNIVLNDNDEDDFSIISELFFYKTNNKFQSLTDLFIEKKKFKNKDKIKMLYSMKNSFVSLFKIVDVDFSEGYVTYQDVFTNKKYKIIDISMSSTIDFKKDKTYYVYNRIITYDDISFGSGIHIMLRSDCKKLKEFLKKHKYNNCSDYSRCLQLYDIFKNSNEVSINVNHNYN